MMRSQIPALERRLDLLHESHKSTSLCISKLANIKCQLDSPSLEDSQGDDIRVELTAEISENLKRDESELDLFKQEIADYAGFAQLTGAGSASERNKAQDRVVARLTSAQEYLRQARIRFRAAQIQSKRNSQLARAQKRDQLFLVKAQGLGGKFAQKRKGLGKTRIAADETVAASGDVTIALRRTHQLLHAEVQRSHFAQEIFNESSEAIRNLSESYNNLATLLTSSKSLLTTLVKSSKSDTWYLETSIYILIATIAWLVFRRFLYGPLWWLAWLPLRSLYTIIFSIFSLIGISSPPIQPGYNLPIQGSHPNVEISTLVAVPSFAMSSVIDQPSEIISGDPSQVSESKPSDTSLVYETTVTIREVKEEQKEEKLDRQ